MARPPDAPRAVLRANGSAFHLPANPRLWERIERTVPARARLLAPDGTVYVVHPFDGAALFLLLEHYPDADVTSIEAKGRAA